MLTSCARREKSHEENLDDICAKFVKMSESSIEYNYLGKSGVRVSNICLGTWSFQRSDESMIPTFTTEELAHQIMDRYAEMGGNFLDTANVYGYGRSEQVVGNWLQKKNRDRFVIATKVRFPMDHNDVNMVGLSRRHIVQSCEHSLERLQTPYIDLLQSHIWDNATPIEETLRTFDDLVRCGKVRYFGVSNVCGWQLQKIIDHIKFMGLNNCVTLQDAFKIPTFTTEELAHQIMDRYAEMGGNFIDTANVYGYGRSEQAVANWLQKMNRDRFVIATKVRVSMDHNDVNMVGLSRRHIVQSCEQSLERLQTPFIDLLQSHIWDNATPIEETLRTFDDLVRCGKVRYFGVSNVCGWQLQKIVENIKFMGLNNCVTLQQRYNLLSRESEFEEIMVCKNEGIGLLPWSPLMGGLLTGKFKRGETPASQESRIGHVNADESLVMAATPAWSQYKDNDTYWRLIDLIASIAQKHGKSVPQVALRWLLQRDVVASVIIGVTSVKQLEDNMGAGTGWSLTDEDMAQLSDVSPRNNVYPYAMIWGKSFARTTNKFNLPCPY